jgi:hypothetical protein
MGSPPRSLKVRERMAVTMVGLGEGKWEFNERELDLKAAFAIKAATGLNLKPFMQGIADMDPLCLQGLVWFVQRTDKPAQRLEDVNFRIVDLTLEQIDDAEPVDPTPAAPTT